MDTVLPPEVQLFILKHLSRHDLTQVARINKSWSTAAISLIWRTIRLLSIGQANIYLNGKETHRRHLHHVKTFQTRLLSAAATMLDDSTACLAPRLSTLDIMVPTHKVYLDNEIERIRHLSDLAELRKERLGNHEPTPSENKQNDDDDEFGEKAILLGGQVRSLLEILRRNPQLESFKMAMIPNAPELFLIQLAPLLPQLKHLELFRSAKRLRPRMHCTTIDAFLRNTSSQLQSLTLECIVFPEVAPATRLAELLEPLMKGGRDKKHPTLKLLRIEAFMQNTWAMTLVPFMQGCSNLRMIESSNPPTPHCPAIEDWARATPIYCSTLEELTGRRVGVFAGTRFWKLASMETDEVIANKISSFMDLDDSRGYWHTINLSNTRASKLTARAIVDCCQEGLTSLNIARCQGIESEDLQAILSKAVNLRHLECNAPVRDGYAPDPVLLMSHLLQSPWACNWLVRLNIHIGGVPRPDIRVNEGGRSVKEGEALDNCTQEESNNLQRKIYEQLGRLTLLEELHLGYAQSRIMGYNEGSELDKVQRNCLAMTLESGLNLLSGLKSLRVLAVVNMAHRIEAPELDWMQLNWLDFHTILGVLFRPYPEDKARVGRQSTWRKMMRGRGLSYT